MRVKSVLLVLAFWLAACGPKAPAEAPKEEEPVAQSPNQAAAAFLEAYFAEVSELEKSAALSYWEAATTGSEEAFNAAGAAELSYNMLHADAERYEQLLTLLGLSEHLEAQQVRALELAKLEFQANQLPPELIEEMVAKSTEIQQLYSNFRGEIDGVQMTNNELLAILSTEKDSAKREKAWKALKQVGEAIGPKIVELAKVRNKAAQSLGFANYWDMQVRLQEHDPEELMAVFAELENMTNAPFKAMKAELDAELAPRFGVTAEAMMPWHYDNPFFQAAPPSSVDLDEFFRDKSKEEIAALGAKFYQDIELPVDDIIANSDLYEREGKDQHAFCTNIDRQGDIRTLLNIKPTSEWMDTMLHELGHAAYDKWLDASLPFNMRQPAHIFTTEAVAMLFGAMAKSPEWIEAYAQADAARVAELRPAILEQRRREQLIFARWTLVMLHFEKALYEDPDQDVNTLWWDYVERFQMVQRPDGRSAADWAAKPHFTIAPVYYHNYMLGELFAAQLRATIATQQGLEQGQAIHADATIGAFMKEKVFAPGAAQSWPDFVKAATGEALSAKYFAAEVE